MANEYWKAVLIRIRLWSKDRTLTTLPVSRRGKGAHWKWPHMSLTGRTIPTKYNKIISKDTDYLNKNSKGNLFILKHYVHSVSNFRPLGLCQKTNNWIYVVSYISIV